MQLHSGVMQSEIKKIKKNWYYIYMRNSWKLFPLDVSKIEKISLRDTLLKHAFKQPPKHVGPMIQMLDLKFLKSKIVKMIS